MDIAFKSQEVNPSQNVEHQSNANEMGLISGKLNFKKGLDGQLVSA